MDSTKYNVLIEKRLLTTFAQNPLKETCKLIPFDDNTQEIDHQYAEKIDGILGVIGLPLVTKCIREESFLNKMPNVKVVISLGAGTDHLNLPLLWKKGIRIATTGKINSGVTAELGFMLLMALARNLKQAMVAAASPETYLAFRQHINGVRLLGSTLGIIGLGSIGYIVAERAAAFKMNILYHNRTRRNQEDENKVQAKYCETIEKLLSQSDFVMLCVPLTDHTKYLIGANELKLMKPSTVLINISRGDVVDQDALVKALQAGAIGGAALDVTTPEPLPADHPLLHMPNVIVTPHAGATKEVVQEINSIAVNNLLAGLKGKPMPQELKYLSHL
ncbi:glyoxylate reductase/hydroxypyruvate reductase-like isoform X2 [Amphiura filiformis]|uniref:glyoxylate reductase/hydroxypyruvate reductase-like isoform X2 n=1 Tax=Amphiura filiformis TaxID=82378 RepID=UPI003B216BEC